MEHNLKTAELNGYSSEMCGKILYKKVKKLEIQNSTSLTPLENDKKLKGFISVPFYPPFTNKLQKILKKENIGIAFSNFGKISDIVGNSKDKIEDSKRQSGIYHIQCTDCPSSYVGQTKRSLREREKEHLDFNKGSVVAAHIRETPHSMEDIELLKRIDQPWKLNAWESFYINKFKEQNLLNEQPLGNHRSCLYDFG